MRTISFLPALLLPVFMFVAMNAFSFGEKEKEPETPNPVTVEVNGKLRLVGSSFMNYLVIDTENKLWYINNEERDKLMHLQHQIVTVKANEYYFDLTYANGHPAGRKYFLKDIVIINAMQLEN